MLSAASRAVPPRLPLWLKIAYTAFLGVLVPVYWRSYTPLNFLWFCDVALAVTFLALWRESALLASMAAVGIVLPQLLWLGDFLCGLVAGVSPLEMSAYMFRYDGAYDLFVRGLSLFHGWLPLLLLWMVWRLGYDRRALVGWTLLAWGVLLASFALLTSGSFDPADPAGPENLNKIVVPATAEGELWMRPWQWLGLLMVAYPLAIYLPSHVLLRAIMPETKGREATAARDGEMSAA